ncbi:M42 family metallopeptidase [Candidatus Parvarchaeota archaeon]|nr:M42 family metallopeptidase [Candidatus Parvarchaeota archaeon]
MDYRFSEIAAFTDAFGIPAHEEEITAVLKSRLEQCGYEVELDMMGDVIARPKSQASARRREGTLPGPIVIAAHMDEIGLLVKFITKSGFLRFAKIGGIDNRMLVNQRVVIKTKKGKIYGVIGNKPPHVTKSSEAEKSIEAASLFIDVGCKSDKQAAKLGVQIGDPICFDMSLRQLANGTITGKAIDNRIGCFALVEVAKALRGQNVVLVGTVQEEVSTFGKGAMISAYNLRPSCFIALDTAVAGDHPEMKEEDGVVKIGGGPAITIVEASGRGNVADKKLAASVIEVAQKKKIACQLEVVEGGATDASSVYNMNGGIPCIAICIPSRYIHSNVSTCNLADVKKTVQLIVELVKSGKIK